MRPLRAPHILTPERAWALGMVREWRNVRHGWKLLLRRHPEDGHFQARFQEADSQIRRILKKARGGTHAG